VRSGSHLADVDMTWGEHFVFAFKVMISLQLMVLALIVHMFMPNCFSTYTSDRIFKMNKKLEERK